jgi:epsilon-lactone hydrolase
MSGADRCASKKRNGPAIFAVDPLLTLTGLRFEGILLMASPQLKTAIDAITQAMKETFEKLAVSPDPAEFNIGRELDEAMAARNPARGMDALIKEARITPFAAPAIRGEWIGFAGSDPAVRILYIHGGGHTGGSVRNHRRLMAYIAKACGAVVCALEYRLFPEHPFPAPLEDTAAALQWIRENGPDTVAQARRVFLMGDSAGGNVALASVLMLKRSGRTLPDAVVALSPETDATNSLPSWQTNAAVDPLLGPMATQIVANAGKVSAYLQGHDPRDPLASPLFGDLEGFPPLLIQVGDAECMRDEAVEFARKAKEAGVDVTLQVWPDMFHVFQGFVPYLPEACQAVDDIGRFVKARS